MPLCRDLQIQKLKFFFFKRLDVLLVKTGFPTEAFYITHNQSQSLYAHRISSSTIHASPLRTTFFWNALCEKLSSVDNDKWFDFHFTVVSKGLTHDHKTIVPIVHRMIHGRSVLCVIGKTTGFSKFRHINRRACTIHKNRLRNRD